MTNDNLGNPEPVVNLLFEANRTCHLRLLSAFDGDNEDLCLTTSGSGGQLY